MICRNSRERLTLFISVKSPRRRAPSASCRNRRTPGATYRVTRELPARGQEADTAGSIATESTPMDTRACAAWASRRDRHRAHHRPEPAEADATTGCCHRGRCSDMPHAPAIGLDRQVFQACRAPARQLRLEIGYAEGDQATTARSSSPLRRTEGPLRDWRDLAARDGADRISSQWWGPGLPDSHVRCGGQNLCKRVTLEVRIQILKMCHCLSAS